MFEKNALHFEIGNHDTSQSRQNLGTNNSLQWIDMKAQT